MTYVQFENNLLELFDTQYFDKLFDHYRIVVYCWILVRKAENAILTKTEYSATNVTEDISAAMKALMRVKKTLIINL